MGQRLFLLPFWVLVFWEYTEIVLIQRGKWTLNLITLLISLFSWLGQLFHSFQNKQHSNCPFLYILYLFVFQRRIILLTATFCLLTTARPSCRSQSRTYLSENPREKPNKSFLELFREKNNYKTRSCTISRYSLVCLDFLNGGL